MPRIEVVLINATGFSRRIIVVGCWQDMALAMRAHYLLDVTRASTHLLKYINTSEMGDLKLLVVADQEETETINSLCPNLSGDLRLVAMDDEGNYVSLPPTIAVTVNHS